MMGLISFMAGWFGNDGVITPGLESLTGSSALAGATVTILQTIGGWPLMLLVILLISGLPLLVVIVLYKLGCVIHALRDEVRNGLTMHQTHYENNVLLVKNYEKLNSELTTQIRMSTAASEKMITLINEICRGGN